MKGSLELRIQDLEDKVKFVTVNLDGNNPFMAFMLSGYTDWMKSRGIDTRPNIYEDERGFVFDITVSDVEIKKHTADFVAANHM